MITITTFSISTDYKSVSLVIDSGVGNTFTGLEMFLGSDYLVPTPIDLSDKLTSTRIETLTITNVDLGLEASETIKGIVTMHCTASDNAENTTAIANLYYANLCLANMIIANDVSNGFNDINTIYLLLKAVSIYLTSNRIEDALNAYERIEAMLNNSNHYLVTDDLTPCEAGSGCWIVNGTYIVK
jgi:hypothetical protein